MIKDLEIKKLEEEKNLLDKQLEDLQLENKRLKLSNEMKRTNIDNLKNIFETLETGLKNE